MKVKVYVLLWGYFHRGGVDSGYSIHTTKEEAIKELQGCYEQAVSNITPNDTHEELDMDEYDGTNGYYYVERYPADSWEKGEVHENEIELDDKDNLHAAYDALMGAYNEIEDEEHAADFMREEISTAMDIIQEVWRTK